MSAPSGSRPSKSRPKLTLAQALTALENITVKERNRLDAYLHFGTFRDAADHLGEDPDTISDTWKRHRHVFAALVTSFNQTEWPPEAA